MTNITSLIVTIVPSILLIAGWVYSRKTEELKIINNQLSIKKYKVYENVISMFYKILGETLKGQKTDKQQNLDMMIEIKKDITLYGSDKVFYAFNKYLVVSANGVNNPQETLHPFFELIIAIREDLSGHKTKIKEKDILLNLMQDKKGAKEFSKKHKNVM